MITQVDPRYLHQDPEATRWLRKFAELPWGLQYITAVESHHCLTFEACLVDDERPLLQWIIAHGGLPIVDPKYNFWSGRAVIFFPSQRSRWYAIQTAGEYLTRDWWWKHTFDYADNDEYAGS